MPIFASVESFDLFECPSADFFDRDVVLKSVTGVADGTYRRVDPDYLAWMEARVIGACRNPSLNSEVISRAVEFFYRVRDACPGITPAPTVPAGYGRPEPHPSCMAVFLRDLFKWE